MRGASHCDAVTLGMSLYSDNGSTPWPSPNERIFVYNTFSLVRCSALKPSSSAPDLPSTGSTFSFSSEPGRAAGRQAGRQAC